MLTGKYSARKWAAAIVTARATDTHTTPHHTTTVSPMQLTLTAQPYAVNCQLSSTALIIIDMQRDFIEPGG